MAVDKKFFVDINLQGNALNDATIGSNPYMDKAGSIRFNNLRLEYYDGSSVQEVANLADIAAVTGGLILQGGYDAATNTPDIADGSALKGFFWVVETAGSFLGVSVQVGDSLIAKVDNAGASIGDWLILQGNVVIATDSIDGIVRLATQEEVDNGTEGGAVVLTPATFENSSQLSDIRSDISSLEDNKLSRDGSQAMTGALDMGTLDINNVGTINVTSVAGTGASAVYLTYGADANNNKITNVSAPTAGTDAANKTYVDDQAAAAQAAAESYADSVANTKLDLAGGTMSGSIDMGNSDIGNVGAIYLTGGTVTGVPTPTDVSDAANKDYVDTAASTATGDANNYTDSAIAQEITDRNSAIATAKGEAIADSNSYTDSAIAQEVTDRDAAIATAKSEAIADANSYTDTQIAAQSFSATYADTEWVLQGSGVYTLDVTHNLNSSVPKVSANVNGGLVEFYVKVDSANLIQLVSNIAPPASVIVGVSK